MNYVERMEHAWHAYVGPISCAEFISRYASRDPWECARLHLRDRAAVYGVVRQHAWDKTFESPVQLRREEAVVLIAAYLEEHRDEWENLEVGATPPTPHPEPQSALGEHEHVAHPPAQEETAAPEAPEASDETPAD